MLSPEFGFDSALSTQHSLAQDALRAARTQRMKQVVQNYRTGELAVEELPPPSLRPGGVLVQTAYSLISAGTERTIVETAQNSLVGKARERPDLVRQVFDTFKREGLKATYEKVKAKLNQIKPLGYSASGVVIAVGSDAGEFRVGDRVACAGRRVCFARRGHLRPKKPVR